MRLHRPEKGAGPPDVTPVDAPAMDEHREHVYRSYEAFLRNRLTELEQNRPSQWPRDYSGAEAYARSVEPMRRRFKEMLGFWVEPPDRTPLRVHDEEVLFEERDFSARRFYLEVLPGLETYAVELAPRSPGPRPGLLAQHGYSGAPELVCGLTPKSNQEDYSYRSLGLRAVRRGFHVIAVHHPTGYGATDDSILGRALPDFPQFSHEYGKNRLHRMAVMGGGTLFGLDMMASSRGIDLLASRGEVDADRIGMYGLSQGGTSALYLAAMDLRIKASVCSAWFDHRFHSMIGPHRLTPYLNTREEDKFFTDIIRLFSDADVASLIPPRAFAVEAGQLDTSVAFEMAADEFGRAEAHYEKLGIPEQIEFIPHAEGHVSATARAFGFLLEKLR